MWFLIVFIIYFFCCRYYQATTFNTFGRPTTPNIPMTYQGSQVRPECFNVLDESYYNFSWIINFTKFFVKMWLFHEKLFLPIIYHIVYRNFAWHVFFNGCFCQKKIIEICKNNILVSRKKNLFRFFNLFFPASFIHTKSRIQPWRGGKSKANYGWESSNPEVVEAGSEVSRAFVSIARGAKEVKKFKETFYIVFGLFFLGCPFENNNIMKAKQKFHMKTLLSS